MLRVLAENEEEYVPVIPDGIYGPETVKAISVFQRKHGLPVTGMTDQATWDTVVEKYMPALAEQDAAHPLFILLEPRQVLRKGERHPHLYLVQAMLTVLGQVYGSIPIPESTGLLDEATADALASFQSLSRLPMTGHLDKITWKHLALHYPMAAAILTDR